MRIFNKFRGTRGFISTWKQMIRFRDMITKQALWRTKVLAFWSKHGLAATVDAFKVKRRTLFNWKRALKKVGANLKRSTRKVLRPTYAASVFGITAYEKNSDGFVIRIPILVKRNCTLCLVSSLTLWILCVPNRVLLAGWSKTWEVFVCSPKRLVTLARQKSSSSKSSQKTSWFQSRISGTLYWIRHSWGDHSRLPALSDHMWRSFWQVCFCLGYRLSCLTGSHRILQSVLPLVSVSGHICAHWQRQWV